MRRALYATLALGVVAVGAWSLIGAGAMAWNDATGELDMPWLGNGARARLFTKQSTCLMCPTGYSSHRSWGRSGGAGHEPYDAVDAALGFLQQRGVLDGWPEAIGEGTVYDGRETITPRAAPYRFTVVMIEPMVIVMRFDLGALIKLGGAEADQAIGTPRLNQAVEFGTRLPASGTLLWFSPDAAQLPTPISLTTPEHGEIVVKNLRLGLDRHADQWTVARPVRAN
jgi:hypothetical protein